MHETLVRGVVVFAFVPIFFILLLYPWGSFPFDLLMAAVAFLSGYEIIMLDRKMRPGRYWPGDTIHCPILCALPVILISFDVSLGLSMAVSLIIALLSCGLSMSSKGLHSSFSNSSTLIFAVIFCGGAFSCCAQLAHTSPYATSMFILVIMIVWISDTMAYFGGRFLPKKISFSLNIAVSPGKTLSGYVCGVLFASFIPILVFSLFRDYWSSDFIMVFDELTFVGLFIFSLFFSILGLYGDLIESALKRSARLKDINKIIPGHGSVLDVFDSLMVVSPVLLIWVLATDPSSLPY